MTNSVYILVFLLILDGIFTLGTFKYVMKVFRNEEVDVNKRNLVLIKAELYLLFLITLGYTYGPWYAYNFLKLFVVTFALFFFSAKTIEDAYKSDKVPSDTDPEILETIGEDLKDFFKASEEDYRPLSNTMIMMQTILFLSPLGCFLEAYFRSV